MSKKEVPLSKLVEDGEIALFEGQPFTGVGVDYYDNGKKKSKTHYKGGKDHGLWTKWDKDGKKTYQKNFIDGEEQ